MSRKRWFRLPVLLALIAAIPFLLNQAGDAQVHLTVAQNFAQGRPFQYNSGGETVVASTSPFWTALLTAYYALVGDGAPLALTITVLVVWLISAYLLYRAARDLWRMEGVALWAVVLLWLGHTTITANALGGLENVLAAMQVLWLYTALGRLGDKLTPGGSVALGLLVGWTILTRPDGGLFALLALGVYALSTWPVDRRGVRTWLVNFALIGGAAALVLIPWYAYQYQMTGRLVTDSSVARLYNGRQGAVPLLPGRLYFHPKTVLSLAGAFLPLAAGFGVTAIDEAHRFMRAWPAWRSFLRERYAQVTAVVLVVVGVVFYSFIVGGEAFGRYFLPLFPFLFLGGVAGLEQVYRRLRARGRRTAALVFVALAAVFLIAASGLDAYRRLGPGRFALNEPLDVIYGPAHRQYYAVNLPTLLRAPAGRPVATDELLAALGAAGETGVSFAVTEVQLRYYLDERVTILSLDGRASADILPYIDPAGGVPDFERYFLTARPDFVHANQWCAVGGWLAGVIPTQIRDNLVCEWEKRAAEMDIGESFSWQGRDVVLVAPEILRIRWD